MSAGTVNITIEQGATFQYVLTWKEYDSTNPPTYEGDPIDLSGYTARAQIRKRLKSEEVMIELTTENGRITLGGALGTISLFIDAEDTEALNFNSGVWDLEMEVSGIVKRLVQGTVTLSKEVTRPVV